MRALVQRVLEASVTIGGETIGAIDSGLLVLAVSQFTLYGSVMKGNRPSWSAAAPPTLARPRFDDFIRALEAQLGKPVATGVFGAAMRVALVNDGPVILWLDSRQR